MCVAGLSLDRGSVVMHGFEIGKHGSLCPLVLCAVIWVHVPRIGVHKSRLVHAMIHLSTLKIVSLCRRALIYPVNEICGNS